MFLKLMLITLVFIAIAFAFIGIKMFLKKDGKFTKQCSTIDPNTGQRMGCTCGSQESTCHND